MARENVCRPHPSTASAPPLNQSAPPRVGVMFGSFVTPVITATGVTPARRPGRVLNADAAASGLVSGTTSNFAL